MKNIIIDTDIFSDVDDAGALLLAATSPELNLLAVNVSSHSSYSALAVSAILAHYGKAHVPIGIRRPLTDATYFDRLHFKTGEYTSKVAHHFSGGSLPWGRAEDAWDPVALYRKALASADDNSVTIVSIGFLDNLHDLLDSPPDTHSPLPGRALLALKVHELIIMGGSYPCSDRRSSWNFTGSGAPARAAHVVNTWSAGRVVFLGTDVGRRVLTGGPLMRDGPERDPVRMAYVWYSYLEARPSWDPLAVMYAVQGVTDGGLFEYGNEGGYNVVDGVEGMNRWVWDGGRRGQFFLRLRVEPEVAAEEVDRLFLRGAWGAVKGEVDGEVDEGVGGKNHVGRVGMRSYEYS